MRQLQPVVQKPSGVESASVHDTLCGIPGGEYGEEPAELRGRFQRFDVRRLLVGQVPDDSQSRLRAVSSPAGLRRGGQVPMLQVSASVPMQIGVGRPRDRLRHHELSEQNERRTVEEGRLLRRPRPAEQGRADGGERGERPRRHTEHHIRHLWPDIAKFPTVRREHAREREVQSGREFFRLVRHVLLGVPRGRGAGRVRRGVQKDEIEGGVPLQAVYRDIPEPEGFEGSQQSAHGRGTRHALPVQHVPLHQHRQGNTGQAPEISQRRQTVRMLPLQLRVHDQGELRTPRAQPSRETDPRGHQERAHIPPERGLDERERGTNLAESREGRSEEKLGFPKRTRRASSPGAGALSSASQGRNQDNRGSETAQRYDGGTSSWCCEPLRQERGVLEARPARGDDPTRRRWKTRP